MNIDWFAGNGLSVPAHHGMRFDRSFLAIATTASDLDSRSAHTEGLVTLTADICLSRRGPGNRIVLPSGADVLERSAPNAALIRALALAYAWRLDLENGGLTIQNVANNANVSRSLVSQQLSLAYLAPDVIEAILQGRQSRSLQLQNFLERLPLDWEMQQKALSSVCVCLK